MPFMAAATHECMKVSVNGWERVQFRAFCGIIKVLESASLVHISYRYLDISTQQQDALINNKSTFFSKCYHALCFVLFVCFFISITKPRVRETFFTLHETTSSFLPSLPGPTPCCLLLFLFKFIIYFLTSPACLSALKRRCAFISAYLFRCGVELS